jgi:hypothetical protein
VREYPWGSCEALSSRHSDLAALKKLLFEVSPVRIACAKCPCCTDGMKVLSKLSALILSHFLVQKSFCRAYSLIVLSKLIHLTALCSDCEQLGFQNFMKQTVLWKVCKTRSIPQKCFVKDQTVHISVLCRHLCRDVKAHTDVSICTGELYGAEGCY